VEEDAFGRFLLETMLFFSVCLSFISHHNIFI